MSLSTVVSVSSCSSRCSRWRAMRLHVHLQLLLLTLCFLSNSAQVRSSLVYSVSLIVGGGSGSDSGSACPQSLGSAATGFRVAQTNRCMSNRGSDFQLAPGGAHFISCRGNSVTFQAYLDPLCQYPATFNASAALGQCLPAGQLSASNSFTFLSCDGVNAPQVDHGASPRVAYSFGHCADSECGCDSPVESTMQNGNGQCQRISASRSQQIMCSSAADTFFLVLFNSSDCSGAMIFFVQQEAGTCIAAISPFLSSNVLVDCGMGASGYSAPLPMPLATRPTPTPIPSSATVTLDCAAPYVQLLLLIFSMLLPVLHSQAQ